MMDPDRFFPRPPAQRQNKRTPSRPYAVERLLDGCSLIWLPLNHTESPVVNSRWRGKDDGHPDKALSQRLSDVPRD